MAITRGRFSRHHQTSPLDTPQTRRSYAAPVKDSRYKWRFQASLSVVAMFSSAQQQTCTTNEALGRDQLKVGASRRVIKSVKKGNASKKCCCNLLSREIEVAIIAVCFMSSVRKLCRACILHACLRSCRLDIGAWRQPLAGCGTADWLLDLRSGVVCVRPILRTGRSHRVITSDTVELKCAAKPYMLIFFVANDKGLIR